MLDWVVGVRSVAENLKSAVEKGALLQSEEGVFSLPPADRGVSPCLFVNTTPHLKCQFLSRFLFDHAYAQAAVPFGCRECYKVVVSPDTLRGLMALKLIQGKIDCHSKCCVELDRPYTPAIYSGFFYCIGLDRARNIYKTVREAVDDDPKLGKGVPIRIKRGCTKYELNCGPSDQYAFRPELPSLEKYLQSRFQHTPMLDNDEMRGRIATMGFWIQCAFRIGDDTYLDFTGGKRLYPDRVDYDPNPVQIKP